LSGPAEKSASAENVKSKFSCGMGKFTTAYDDPPFAGSSKMKKSSNPTGAGPPRITPLNGVAPIGRVPKSVIAAFAAAQAPDSANASATFFIRNFVIAHLDFCAYRLLHQADRN